MENISNICGYEISSRSLEGHLALIREYAEAKKGAWIVTLNTEMLARSNKEPEYQSLLQSADLIVADGMPLVWASQKKKNCDAIAGRTTGVDLVEDLLTQAPIYDFAILGGVAPEKTLDYRFKTASDHCKFLFTGMVDCSSEQVDEFVEQIKSNNIRLVYLALGVPKQDKLALLLREKLPEVIFLGIGGTFEILGPDGGRAPAWMQKSGMEWLYRFSREPGRLWKRYALNYPVGIRMLVKDQFSSDRSSS